MTLVLRFAATLTAALAVGLSVGPATASAATSGTDSTTASATASAGEYAWCMRIGPGTNGPCPVTPPPALF
jgi:hypothetical protein